MRENSALVSLPIGAQGDLNQSTWLKAGGMAQGTRQLLALVLSCSQAGAGPVLVLGDAGVGSSRRTFELKSHHPHAPEGGRG